MGRGRSRKSSEMEREVPVKLSDQQLLAKARELTTKLTTVRGLRRNLSAATRRSKDEIKQLEGEVEVLRQEIADGFELLPQGSLFAQDLERLAGTAADDGKVPKDQAAQALGKIAEKAGDKPKPTEPHTFGGDDHDKPCGICGATYMDPVHHGGDPLADTPQAAVAPEVAKDLLQQASKLMECPACKAKTCRAHPHAFNPSEHDPDKCTCGYAKRAKVHRVEVEEAAAETLAPGDETNGAAAETKAVDDETPSKVVPFAVPEATRAAEAQG